LPALHERNQARAKEAGFAQFGAKKETMGRFNHEVYLERAALFTEATNPLNEASIHASQRQFRGALAIV